MIWIAKADRILGLLLRLIPMACLVGLFAILGANIVSRYFQLWSIAWFDEIVEGLFAWFVFIGSAALWREHEHFRVDWLAAKLTGRYLPRLHAVLVCLISIAFLVVMTWKGWLLTANSGALTPILGLPTALFYVSIPLSGLAMLAYCLVDLRNAMRRHRPIDGPPGKSSHQLEAPGGKGQ